MADAYGAGNAVTNTGARTRVRLTGLAAQRVIGYATVSGGNVGTILRDEIPGLSGVRVIGSEIELLSTATEEEVRATVDAFGITKGLWAYLAPGDLYALELIKSAAGIAGDTAAGSIKTAGDVAETAAALATKAAKAGGDLADSASDYAALWLLAGVVALALAVGRR